MVRLLTGAVLATVGVWFCLLPLLTALFYIWFDHGLVGNGPSRYAIRIHRHLAGRYERYGRDRIASGVATTLGVHQVAETEWPLFGSMFFLSATEALQTAWENDPEAFPGEQRVYARGAIDAARDLHLDPGHATSLKT